jgi:O-antigen ligase
VRATAVLGAVYAAWGLFVYWSGNRSVLWFDKWAYLNDLTSTFVNRNFFAVYCGLAALAALGLLVEALLGDIDLGQTRRAVLSSLTELLTARLAWLVGMLLVIATALLLTHSRGGAAVSAAGVATLLGAMLLAPSHRRNRRLAAALAFGIGLAALVVLVISGTTTLTRVADTSLATEDREKIYAYTLQALAERPLLGTGLGTFETVFMAHRDDTLHLVIEYAHDDYLESALELGIPAAILLLSAPALLLWTCARGVIRRRRDSVIPAIGVAAGVLVGVHSLIDFSLQIPAVATSFYLLLGAGVAQSYSTSERSEAVISP